MLKKILFLVTIFSASSLLFANDPLKTIAQEIDNDLQTCSDNQDCISKIDKHLINLKQLQDQLKSFHMGQVPYAFSWESMRTLLGLNFAPAVGYLASKMYTGDTAGPKLISLLVTSLWGLSEWFNYSHRKTKLAQIEELIKFLENKKKDLKQAK